MNQSCSECVASPNRVDDVNLEPTVLERIRGKHISTFQLISDEEYRAGLERAERELPGEMENVLEWIVAVAVKG